MKKQFSDFLSIDQAKMSALILGFFIVLGFSMAQYATTGTIDINALNLLYTLIYVITGIEVSREVRKGIVEKNVHKSKQETTKK
ncbi:hypothetical protein [Halobacillus litoralis]|uniref:hypothetical protein n=1 Tax=Halobacillus litoralis TaxID=45668 RepID=UPI001CD2514D|nr:hypothetical protein [Halobacillus litoralis]MCA1021667.1 hypothetical protein [Halobacillus litoralis]